MSQADKERILQKIADMSEADQNLVLGYALGLMKSASDGKECA